MYCQSWEPPETPKLAVDAVIYDFYRNGFIIIERQYSPYGFALPGGFVDIGETTEEAIIREVKEETNLDCEIKNLIGVYSEPNRDPRYHIISVAYNLDIIDGELKAKDDAKSVRAIHTNELLSGISDKMINDHFKILKDGMKIW